MRSPFKSLFITLAVFSAGFYFHSLVTSTPLLPPQISSSKYTKMVLGTSNEKDKYTFHNKVVYDGNSFKPSFIMMVRDSYLEIMNQSKTKGMWLNSSDPEFSTPRAYLESEQLQAHPDKVGDYTIVNKDNPSAILTVKVVTDY